MEIHDRTAECKTTNENWQDWLAVQPPYPEFPGCKEYSTSLAAAQAIAPKAKTLRAQVLNFISELPPGDELTADQIAARLSRSPFSIRPRISELAALGLIERTRERGTNESGMTAARWRLANA